MVTLAGDEITEALMRALLVDFRTAEAIKRDLWNGADLHYTDILGVENTTSYAAVYEVIQEPMRRLAEAIAAQVSSVNGGAPSAVFLAGGGAGCGSCGRRWHSAWEWRRDAYPWRAIITLRAPFLKSLTWSVRNTPHRLALPSPPGLAC